MKIYNDLGKAIKGGWQYILNTGVEVKQKNWQGKKAPVNVIEAVDFCFRTLMPRTREEAVQLIKPNLPWAEDHFKERISGKPLNPPPSSFDWPFSQDGNADYKMEGKFDHTYPERFWPKYAGGNSSYREFNNESNVGIRFRYGDLMDVMNKLIRDPLTRQAYLPIWFPEDTGLEEHLRVPCSLGYHFMIRNGRLDIKYIMRSTDMLRHYQDDVYMCFLLADHIKYQLDEFVKMELGYMTFITFSAHVFKGEEYILNKKCAEF